MLPRQMRFFRLWDCRVGADGLQTQPLDLRKLPSLMEELHLFRTALQGKICIGRLPETMRIVDIGDQNIRTAAVYFEGLPKNLFSMLRYLDKKNIDTIAVKAIPNDGIGLAINDRLIRGASK